jgi:hypothetical protein
MQVAANKGLKHVAKQAWVQKIRQQTKTRLQTVVGLTNGHKFGQLTNFMGFEPAYIVAVLKLAGYHAEAKSDRVLFTAL